MNLNCLLNPFGKYEKKADFVQMPLWKNDEALTSSWICKKPKSNLYGYIPQDSQTITEKKDGFHIPFVSGTILDDLTSESNISNLIEQIHTICSNAKKIKLGTPLNHQDSFPAFLILSEGRHDERDATAGDTERARRLSSEKWSRMIKNILLLSELSWDIYNTRALILPHAGGYIEFADEINKLAVEIPYLTAGFCFDTAHLYYSGMDPLRWLYDYGDRLDYVLFKDITPGIIDRIRNENIGFNEALTRGVFCQLGRGILDYPSMMEFIKSRN